MKRQWDIEELIEHFTLVEDDLEFLANKTGPTRLGCALLLKGFQYEGRFPPAKHDVPQSVVDWCSLSRVCSWERCHFIGFSRLGR